MGRIAMDIEGTIENSNGVWRGDIQEQRGTLEACG